jgi:hypothetical protein
MDETLAQAVGAEAGRELGEAFGRIRHCLVQLTDEQIWWRPAAGMNSVGNLVLHLCGNLGQWVVAGLGGAADTRNRPAEFAERGPIPRAELLGRLEEVVGRSRAVLGSMTEEALLKPRRIQGWEVTGLRAVFSSVPHFRGHTQEIIHLTRAQLGDRYKFAWVPQTPEQGATPF